MSPKLLFKEQWWLVSCFTSLKGDSLLSKVAEIGEYAQERVNSFQEKDINKKFVKDEIDRKNIIKIAQNLQIQIEWKTYVEDFDYWIKDIIYHDLGYMMFRVRISDAKDCPIKPEDITSNYMQQIIFRLWFGMIKKFDNLFKFDDSTPPYVISVCVGYNPGEPYISWTRKTIDQYKQDIGPWVEIYSGQFPDYRDSLYERRIEKDLSNRKSEMHFINRNSGLIYMDPQNYLDFFIKNEEFPNSTGYVHDAIIVSIIQIRTITFAMSLVSKRIDDDTKSLSAEDADDLPPSQFKDLLERTNRLKMQLQNTLLPFFTDLTRSHRQHYTAVLTRCVELNKIEHDWDLISDKIESNTQILNSIFLEKQEKASKQQEKILNLVNYVLGAGIVFDILAFVLPEPIMNVVSLGLLGLMVTMMGFFVSNKLKRKKNGEID